MARIWAEQALTSNGWENSVVVEISENGRIASVEAERKPVGERHSILIPAGTNVHSHAFQRAMAGLAESRPSKSRDDFWGWRQLMYKFLERLAPDEVEAIAAFVQMEMLEAGYASVGEFHYLHHGRGGKRYERISEMSARIAAAAAKSGIGLTLLPTLYERGGCDGRPLEGGQRRFGCSLDEFAELIEGAEADVAHLTNDCVVGTALHSLRAVSADSVVEGAGLRTASPIHIHAAEQRDEVVDVEAATGRRPVDWLLEHAGLNGRWCLIHCTHMTDSEAIGLANSGAVAGVCPITESNLGDGIFNGIKYFGSGGSIAVGTDSNVQVTQAGEFRTLEYSQRLSANCRSALAVRSPSTGRSLLEACAEGGARAIGRHSGSIAPGMLADLVELDGDHANLQELAGDRILDAWIFAEKHGMVRAAWSAGRKLVRDGIHIRRDEIEAEYRKINGRLRDAI